MVNYSGLISPLTKLLRKNVPFVFDSECKKAFESLKQAFKSPLILRNFTVGEPVYVQVDASMTSIAGLLLQKYHKTGKLCIIDSAGRQLNKHEVIGMEQFRN